MNRFSEGFSNNSYEDLLNEYAEDNPSAQEKKVVPPSPQKSSVSPVQRKAPTTNTRPASVSPVQRGQGATRQVASTQSKPIAPTNRGVQPVKRTPVKQPTEEKLNLDFSKTRSAHNTPSPIETLKSFEEEQKEKEALKLNGGGIDSTMEFSKAQLNNSNRKGPVIEKRTSNAQLAAQRKTAPKQRANTGGKPSKSSTTTGQKKKKKLTMKEKVLLSFKKNWIGFVALISCFVIAIIVSSVALSCINDVLAIKYDDDKTIEVNLPNDANTDVALEVLENAGLIKNKWFCKIFLQAMGYTDENYRPGVYYLDKTMGLEKMIIKFKVPSVKGNVISVMIPEGYTIDQIFERLEKNDVCSASSLYKTIEDVDFSKEYAFLESVDNKEARYHVLEGYMFPATYEFEQGADPATVIRKFLDAFKARWTEEYAQKAEALGMTVDEVITLASIVEKEGYGSIQFTQISSVLHNRLNRSGLYPNLECDSTRDYVTNTIAKRVTNRGEINTYISNYSTYERSGLPVGAICNPGIAAIEAALEPDDTNYYFFAHNNQKKLYMAANWEQHQANLRQIKIDNTEE